MKIKVIAQRIEQAEALARAIAYSAPGSEMMTAHTESRDLLTAVNGSRPNLLILDEADARTLQELSTLSNLHPDLDAIVISSAQTPEFLLAAMKAGVRDVLPSPVDPHALAAAVQRVVRKRGVPLASGKHARVLALMPCKGGNGASFLAANLAYTLAHRGAADETVGLLDLDLQYGDCLLMLTDQAARSDVAEVAEQLARMDASLLSAAMVQVSPTLSVLAAPNDMSQALTVTPAHIESIVRQARSMFDHVVINVSRTIDAVTLKALDLADVVLPVAQLTIPNVRDAKRLQALFRSLEYPAQKVQWVINRHERSSEITLASFDQTLGVQNTYVVPNHHAGVMASVNHGVPLEKTHKSNPVVKALHQMAQTVAPVEKTGKNGWFASMFARH